MGVCVPFGAKAGEKRTRRAQVEEDAPFEPSARQGGGRPAAGERRRRPPLPPPRMSPRATLPLRPLLPPRLVFFFARARVVRRCWSPWDVGRQQRRRVVHWEMDRLAGERRGRLRPIARDSQPPARTTNTNSIAGTHEPSKTNAPQGAHTHQPFSSPHSSSCISRPARDRCRRPPARRGAPPPHLSGLSFSFVCLGSSALQRAAPSTTRGPTKKERI